MLNASLYNLLYVTLYFLHHWNRRVIMMPFCLHQRQRNISLWQTPMMLVMEDCHNDSSRANGTSRDISDGEVCIMNTPVIQWRPSWYHDNSRFLVVQYMRSIDCLPWTAAPKSLSHSGRVTHICVRKLRIIGSDNGLSPGRRRAIIRTNAGILLFLNLATNFSEILSETYTSSSKKLMWKCRMENANLSRPQCVIRILVNWDVGICCTFIDAEPGCSAGRTQVGSSRLHEELTEDVTQWLPSCRWNFQINLFSVKFVVIVFKV